MTRNKERDVDCVHFYSHRYGMDVIECNGIMFLLYFAYYTLRDTHTKNNCHFKEGVKQQSLMQSERP